MSLAYIDNERRTFDRDYFLIIRLQQSGKCRQHRDRKIIDAEVSEILECIRRRAHPGAA